MEGVVIVALPAGTLHYTRSFSTRFDRRYPRADRMNLAALIFALHHFAENTLASDHDSEPTQATAAIAHFATSDEQLATALTPSKKFLVVLFLSPSADTGTAKWLAIRIARDFESVDSADSRIMASLNQVSGLFRLALMNAVEALVDQKLAGLALKIQERLGGSLKPHALGFYCKWSGSEIDVLEGAVQGGSDDGIIQERYNSSTFNKPSEFVLPPSGAVAPAPTAPAAPRGKLTRLPSRVETNSRVFLSTRSLLPVPKANAEYTSGKEKKRKASKKAKKKNAVVDYVEPRILHRSVHPRDDLSIQVNGVTLRECLAGILNSMIGALEDCAPTHYDKTDCSVSVRILTWKNPPVPSECAGSDITLLAFYRSKSVCYWLVPTECASVVALASQLHQAVEKDLGELEQLVSVALST